MSIIDHIILFTFLFIVFFFWGKYYNDIKNKYQFWCLALIPIFLYAFIVGSRYGWGIDYLSYKKRFEHPLSTGTSEQIAFGYINETVKILGLNYTGAFIVYSVIFITCAFVLLRSYRSEAKYMYAFLIPATLSFTSSFIRQGIAYSFILLAIYFLNHKKWLGVVICVAIGIMIHSAIMFTVLVLGIFYLVSKKPFNWKITIPLYLFFTFIYDVSKVGIFVDYLKYLSFNSVFSSYIENSDRWFGADAVEDKYEQGMFPLIISSIFYISIFYLGYKVLKIRPNKQINYLFNTVVFGVVFYRAFFQIELYRRIGEPMVMLYFIVLGYIIYVYSELNRRMRHLFINRRCCMISKKELCIYHFLLLGITSYLLLFWGRFILFNPQAMFFWNK
jgi:hypothetical protein